MKAHKLRRLTPAELRAMPSYTAAELVELHRAETPTTLAKWAAEEAAKVKRPCAICGESQSRKKVWARYGKRVICMGCHIEWAFWVDGSTYNRTIGPSNEQRAQLEAKETA